MLRYPRILFYAVNGLGLGHVTRLLAIARQVRKLAPEAEIVFFTSSEAEDVIFREGFAAFKVPSKSIRMEAGLRSATYARMLQTVTLNLLASFHPHVLVVDTFPAGAIQELLPVLRWESRKVFVYRAQRAETARSPLMQNTLQLYDLAIIPHFENEVEAPMPEGLARVWTGPIIIREKGEAKERVEARDILGLPADGNVLYITFGGGGDSDMDEALTTAMDTLSSRPDLHLAVASAPLYRGRIRRSERLTPVDHYPMAELYTAFDAALTATGYNTAMELLHHGVPSAFVPFPRQVDDQDARACAIEAAGAGIRVAEMKPGSLLSAVDDVLNPHRAAAIGAAAQLMVPESGARRAAEAIAGLLG